MIKNFVSVVKIVQQPTFLSDKTTKSKPDVDNKESQFNLQEAINSGEVQVNYFAKRKREVMRKATAFSSQSMVIIPRIKPENENPEFELSDKDTEEGSHSGIKLKKSQFTPNK